MLNGLLPIGTVVLLKNSEKRLMIIGLLQKQNKDGQSILWDYSACLYPEGYMGPNKTFLFNEEQIDKVFAVGYQDEEQFAFKIQIDQVRADLYKAAAGEEEQTDAQ